MCYHKPGTCLIIFNEIVTYMVMRYGFKMLFKNEFLGSSLFLLQYFLPFGRPRACISLCNFFRVTSEIGDFKTEGFR